MEDKTRMGKDLKDITKEIKSFFPIYDDMISSKNIENPIYQNTYLLGILKENIKITFQIL